MKDVFAAAFQAVLWLWFFGCIVTYKTKKYILVEGMGIKSAEFVMLCLYSLGVICYYAFDAGRAVLLGVLSFWMTVQFFCHWRYTIFGASENKLKGYNECFADTVHIIPLNDNRLIPDLYHIILHMLIIVNIVICLL